MNSFVLGGESMRVQVANHSISRISNESDHKDMLTKRNVPDMTHSSIGNHVTSAERFNGRGMQCNTIPYHKTKDIVVVHDKTNDTNEIFERIKRMKF